MRNAIMIDTVESYRKRERENLQRIAPSLFVILFGILSFLFGAKLLGIGLIAFGIAWIWLMRWAFKKEENQTI